MTRPVRHAVVSIAVLVALGCSVAWAGFQAGGAVLVNGYEVAIIAGDEGKVAGVAGSTQKFSAAVRADMIAQRLNDWPQAVLGTAWIDGPRGCTNIWVNAADGPRRVMTVNHSEAAALRKDTVTIAAHWANILRWVYGGVQAPDGWEYDGETTWCTIPDAVPIPQAPEGVQLPRRMIQVIGLSPWWGCGCCPCGCWQWDPACGTWRCTGCCVCGFHPCQVRSWPPPARGYLLEQLQLAGTGDYYWQYYPRRCPGIGFAQTRPTRR